MTHYLIHSRARVEGSAASLLAALQTQPGALLRAALALPPDEPGVDGSFTFAARVGDGSARRFVSLAGRLGPAVRAAREVQLPLQWRPVNEPFSHFEGTLTVAAEHDGGVEVALSGDYSVSPDVPAPTVVAAATGRTVERVVQRFAAALRRVEGTTAAAGESRRSPLRVRDVMSWSPLTLPEDLPLRAAALLLVHHDLGGAPVVSGHGDLLGVVTESDLLAREAAPRQRRGWAARDEDRRRHAATVGQACSRPAFTVSPETRLQTAARELLDRDISRLVVVDGDAIVGVLSRRDVLRALTRSASELQDAVEVALATAGAGGVTAEVSDNGHVRLRGSVERRATADRAVDAVAAVDGVTRVDEQQLRWTADDQMLPAIQGGSRARP